MYRQHDWQYSATWFNRTLYALCNPVLDNTGNLLYSRCGIPLRFGWLLVLSLYKEAYLQNSKCVSFWLHGFCCSWEGWALVYRFDNTNWFTVVTPTDRPKSVRNSCVIELFDGVFCVVMLLLDFSVGEGAFCYRNESDLFRFVLRRLVPF